jgi:hypothetical protein
MNKPRKENWTGWYVAVIAILVLQLILYYWFTQHWS